MSLLKSGRQKALLTDFGTPYSYPISSLVRIDPDAILRWIHIVLRGFGIRPPAATCWKAPYLPATFILPDLVAITAPAFELKINPHYNEVDVICRKWFKKFDTFGSLETETAYLDAGNFHLFAGLSYPFADRVHLETCLIFYLWAFAMDDDYDAVQNTPYDIQAGLDVNNKVVLDEESAPKLPYAVMLQDLLRRLQMTATPGNYSRFLRGYYEWTQALVKQSRNRQNVRMPSVEEFIEMRRSTIGAKMAKALVEYSVDIDLPDYVFEDPVVFAMSEATIDILTWPNDLCSFNKEQADGDYQNLVFVLMHEHQLGLQAGIDRLTLMITQRVQDYTELKKRLPSFGKDVDAELERYHKHVEYYVQGTVVWYYESPRYFKGVDVSNRNNLSIRVLPKTTP